MRRVTTTATNLVLKPILLGAILLVSHLPPVVHADEIEQIEQLGPDDRAVRYKELLKKKPGSPEILFKLGNAYFDLESYEQAAETYRAAWEAGAGDKAVLNLAFVLDKEGLRDEEGKVYEEALAKEPDNAQLRAHYGDYLSEGEDEGEAIRLAMEQYRRALNADPNSLDAHFGLGVLFARSGILGEAIVEWNRVVEIDVNSDLARTARTNILRAEAKLGR